MENVSNLSVNYLIGNMDQEDESLRRDKVYSIV